MAPMICWSCRKIVPADAKFCPHCEAEIIDEPTESDGEFVADILTNMPPEALDEIRDAIQESSDGEEFVRRILVGDCPKCQSKHTSDCESDPDLKDPSIGRCFDCGQLWCLDCGELFETSQSTRHDCPVVKSLDEALEILDTEFDDEDDEFEDEEFEDEEFEDDEFADLFGDVFADDAFDDEESDDEDDEEFDESEFDEDDGLVDAEDGDEQPPGGKPFGGTFFGGKNFGGDAPGDGTYKGGNGNGKHPGHGGPKKK